VRKSPTGAEVAKVESSAQLREGILGGNTFDLHDVGLRELVARIGDAVLQAPIVRQQQQALAVGVESTCGIDTGHVDAILECRASSLVGELAQDAKGLVEEDQAGHDRRGVYGSIRVESGDGAQSWRRR